MSFLFDLLLDWILHSLIRMHSVAASWKERKKERKKSISALSGDMCFGENLLAVPCLERVLFKTRPFQRSLYTAVITNAAS